ncbi:hypothetical protein VCSRO166_3171 [Vibrio cholerae]|nr:hypothetical protein VCSRO166_3171 [Vibrio cholerae]
MAQTQPVVFSSDYVVQKDVKFITGKLIQLERQVFSDLLHCAAYQSLKHGVLRNGNVMAGKVFNGRIKEVSRLQPGMTNVNQVVAQSIEVLFFIPLIVI